MGKARRCLWLLTALMLICAAMPTLAASKSEGTQVYVYAYALKVYEKPSKKSDVIARVPFARSLWMVAEKKGWAQVITADDRTGYCSAKQLTERNPNTYDATVYAQQDRAPVYELPSVDAPMIGHLDRNDRAKLLAMTPSGDWLRVQYGSHDGYIQRPRVDYKKYSSGKSAWVVSDKVSVYYDPSIDSSFGDLSRGQQVGLVSVDGGWAKIRSGSGLIAYCRADALTTEKP